MGHYGTDFKICFYFSFVLALVFLFLVKTSYKQINKILIVVILWLGVKHNFICFFLLSKFLTVYVRIKVIGKDANTFINWM